jgi:sugar phosphate permease
MVLSKDMFSDTEIKRDRYGWFVFSLLSLMFIFSYFIRLSTGVLGPSLMEDLRLSPGHLGLIAGAFFYAFGASQIPVGMALDTFSPKRVIISTTLLGALGCLLMGVATSFKMAMAGRILLGMGMSSVLMGSLKIFANWFQPSQFGFVAGFMLSLGNLGGLIAAAPLIFMANSIGWRSCFLLFGIFVVVMTVVISILVKDSPRTNGLKKTYSKQSKQSSAFSSLKVVFSSKDFWLIGMSSFVRYGALISIQGFLGTLYLVDVMGYSAQQAGNVLSMISFGYIVGGPLSGHFSDTVFRSRKKVMVAGLFSFGSLIAPFLLDITEGPLFWYVIFFGLGFFSSIGAVAFAHVKELFPAEISGVAFTSTNFLIMAGAAMGQHGLGYVIEMFPQAGKAYPPAAYRSTFTIIFIASAVAFVLYLMVRDSKVLPLAEG